MCMTVNHRSKQCKPLNDLMPRLLGSPSPCLPPLQIKIVLKSAASVDLTFRERERSEREVVSEVVTERETQ